MKIYIAYKYRHHSNKQQLQSELESLADFFDKNGHHAFILGRDVQKWNSLRHSKISTLFEIIKNIGKHDTLFVYNDSEAPTSGLPVELILAKLLGLRIIFSSQKALKPWFFEKFADKVIKFTDFEDLTGQLAHGSLLNLARVA